MQLSSNRCLQGSIRAIVGTYRYSWQIAHIWTRWCSASSLRISAIVNFFSNCFTLKRWVSCWIHRYIEDKWKECFEIYPSREQVWVGSIWISYPNRSIWRNTHKETVEEISMFEFVHGSQSWQVVVVSIKVLFAFYKLPIYTIYFVTRIPGPASTLLHLHAPWLQMTYLTLFASLWLSPWYSLAYYYLIIQSWSRRSCSCCWSQLSVPYKNPLLWETHHRIIINDLSCLVRVFSFASMSKRALPDNVMVLSECGECPGTSLPRRGVSVVTS